MAKRKIERADPRVVGGRYHNGYWGVEYDVLKIERSDDWGGTWWTVRDVNGWNQGMVRTHCTAWDWRRDRILSQPES